MLGSKKYHVVRGTVNVIALTEPNLKMTRSDTKSESQSIGQPTWMNRKVGHHEPREGA